MRIVDANDVAEQQKAAERERLLHQRVAAILGNPDLTEIPRSALREVHAGLLEHDNDSGDWYRVFPGGEPGYLGKDVSMYFVDSAGEPVLLQRAQPRSRREFEQQRAKRDERRAADAAAVKALYQERRKELERK